MSQFLLRKCDGRTDNEVSVALIQADALTFEDRQEIANAQARAIVEHAVDEMTTEASGDINCYMEEMSPGRWVFVVDGTALWNVHACLG